MTAQTPDCFRFLGPIIFLLTPIPGNVFWDTIYTNIRFHEFCLIQSYKRFQNVIYRYLHKIKPDDHTRVDFSIHFGQGENFPAPTLFKTTRKIMNCFFLSLMFLHYLRKIRELYFFEYHIHYLPNSSSWHPVMKAIFFRF